MPEPSELPGSSTLLMGAPGSGKTTSLVSFIEAGLELFVVITDPRGEESLLSAMEIRNLPMDKLHWAYIAPATADWTVMDQMAQKIGLLSYKDLTELKMGVEKRKFQQFHQLLSCLANFKCARTGEEYGAVDSWAPSTNRAVAIDSLSGINTMALNMMIGAKPAAHQGEWGVAMNAEERLIAKLCSDVKCFFALTSHLDLVRDETIGRSQLMAGALGNKLAPKLPKDFSDVVMAYREGSEFFWSTVASNADLKARNLPLLDKMAPSFVPVVEKWKKRKEQIAVGKPATTVAA